MEMKRTKADIIIDVVCLLISVGITAYLFIGWKSFPEQIPMHYDFAGNIDRWGRKKDMIFLPIMSWILYLFMCGVECIPQAWNTGVKVTEENKERVYRVLRYLLKSIKLLVVLVFAYITLDAVWARPEPSGFIVGFMLLFFGDIAYWIFRLVRIK